MAKYFTAYRIDHILGFFRIWELPDHAMTGLVGKFRPSIPLSQVNIGFRIHVSSFFINKIEKFLLGFPPLGKCNFYDAGGA